MLTLYDYPVRDITDIDRYLSRLLKIIEKGDFDATVCSAAFIARAVMRMVAEHHSIYFEIQSTTDRVIEEHEKVAVEANFARKTVEMVQRLDSFHSQLMECQDRAASG